MNTEKYQLLATLTPSLIHLAVTGTYPGSTRHPVLYAVHNKAKGTRLVVGADVKEAEVQS